jgi:hypothetical protein
MANKYTELDNAAQTAALDGCPLRDALGNIPWTEHLQAIQSMKQHLASDSRLDVLITPGSVPNAFEYSVYSTRGPSNAEIDNLAQALKMSSEEVRQMVAQSRRNMPPMLILHEKFDLKAGATSSSFNYKIDCYGP